MSRFNNLNLLLELRQSEALLAVAVIFPPSSSTATFRSSLFLLSLPTATSFMPVRGLSACAQIKSTKAKKQFLIRGFSSALKHLFPNLEELLLAGPSGHWTHWPRPRLWLHSQFGGELLWGKSCSVSWTWISSGRKFHEIPKTTKVKKIYIYI